MPLNARFPFGPSTLRRLACVLALSAAACAAAQTMAGMNMAATKPVPPPSELPAPIAMTGIGNSHITISATPEAQVWFDQGLNLLHDFWDYESARAFEQAVRVDPNCAMCYWGLSQALGFTHGSGNAYAKDALDNAVRLKGHASKIGRLYIEAEVAEQAEAIKPTKGPITGPAKPAESKTTSIYRQIVKKDPKNPQGYIFLAESLMDGYDDKGEPRAGTREGIAVLEQALKIAPNDSAANHYWIHAQEPGNHPERALPSAQMLASLAPSSGHMVHMPGHIFYRVGNYASAEHWFAASTAVDENYMRTQHVSADNDWNYVHNLMYGIANYLEEGKLAQATALSAKLAGARGDSSSTLYTFSPRDSMTRINVLLPIALRTADWKQVQTLLADAKPNDKLPHLVFLAGQLRQFAAGMQAVDDGNLDAAEAASNALDAQLWRTTQDEKQKAAADMAAKMSAAKPSAPDPSKPKPVTQEIMPDAMSQPLISSLSIMSLELRASILAARKKLPEAKSLFTEAARQEKELGYREPPMFIRPVGEAEGYALLQAGDPAGAHAAYAAALAERPNSGFALYGMARSSEAAHNSALAHTEYQKFLDAWHDSDPNSQQLAHAHTYLATQATVARN